jgi:hypothetical protein
MDLFVCPWPWKRFRVAIHPKQAQGLWSSPSFEEVCARSPCDGPDAGLIPQRAAFLVVGAPQNPVELD